MSGGSKQSNQNSKESARETHRQRDARKYAASLRAQKLYPWADNWDKYAANSKLPMPPNYHRRNRPLGGSILDDEACTLYDCLQDTIVIKTKGRNGIVNTREEYVEFVDINKFINKYDKFPPRTQTLSDAEIRSIRSDLEQRKQQITQRNSKLMSEMGTQELMQHLKELQKRYPQHYQKSSAEHVL